ncbi:MAG: lysylphosphatidylglycerol synthase transmembrane domain-containing protein [Dehalococcoidia bacterium]
MRRFVLGMLFTVASVLLLVRLMNWQIAWDTLQAADPGYIALATTTLLLSLTAKAIRWRLLLPRESSVTTPRLFRIMHISFMLNNILPARLGDVARVAMTARQPGMRFGHVVSSLLTERVTDLVVLVCCFAMVSPFLPIPPAYKDWLHLAWMAIASAVALLVLGYALKGRLRPALRHLPALGRLPGLGKIGAEADSFREGWRQLFNRRSLLPIWGWSAFAWAGAFAINFLLMRALKIDAPITVAVLLTCTTNLAMLVPSSPGYLGVFHAAATLSLLPFDVASGAALSFAILAHLVNVLPVSIIGAAFLLANRDQLDLKLPRRGGAGG